MNSAASDDRTIQDRPSGASARRVAIAVGALVAAAGAMAAWHYAQAGMALSHYDARAHLVVARRVLDSLTPGWQQIGAVWLPLPHVLNLLPVQIDSWYRSGASGVAISVLSLATGAGALAWIVMRTTGSGSAAVAGAALLMLNPNVLYLQSTPMTEPLLFGTTLLAVALTAGWLDRGASGPPRAAGLALSAACLTRYEAWPITAAVIGLAGAVLLRRGATPRYTATACTRLALYPLLAITIFVLNSRWTVGAWFVSGGFFVPENEALGQPLVAWRQVEQGLYRLSGRATVWPAWASLFGILFTFARSKSRAVLVLVLAMGAAAALPWYAFLQGHPLRIRYSLPLVVACAALTAAGVALLPRRVRALAAIAVVAATLMQASPFDRSARLIVESRRDERHESERAAVTAYLRDHRDGRPIMVSMGSLAHYMHDLSAVGLDIHDFLHEGNGELWVYAMSLGARGHVGWVLIEERAEGGDMLYHHARTMPHFLAGFDRVAEGGGVALYKGPERF